MNGQKLKVVLEQFEDSLIDLFPQKDIKQLIDFTLKLPPAHRGAFEVQLESNSGFDFHINYKNSDDLSGLILFLSKNEFANNISVRSVLEFVTKWDLNYKGFRDFISGIFLEFDSSKEQLVLPNLFIRLNFKMLCADQRIELVRELCNVVKGESFYKTYELLFQNLIYNESGYELGYLGFMLPRQEHLLRLNIHRVSHNNLNVLLKDVFGFEDQKSLNAWFKRVVDIVDNTILSFDFYEGKVLNKIGLELFYENQPSLEPRWEQLLNQLSLSDSWKNIILNNWNGYADALGVNKFPKLLLKNKEGRQFVPVCFKQLLSHVKLVFQNDKITEKKAYLGLGAVTPIEYSSKEREVQNGSPLERAISFLISEQQQSGFWRDFQIFKGFSDQWTTAFIGNILTEIPQTNEVRKAIDLAWGALKRSYKVEKGWGYNYYTPVDGDSTSWCLLLASKVDPEFFEKQKTVINRFLIEGEGITTYVDKKEIMEYINLGEEDSYLGWNSAHNCISAVANQVPGIDVGSVLNSKMNDNGSWKGYWWDDDLYTTFQVTRSLGFTKEVMQYLYSRLDEVDDSISTFYLSNLLLMLLEINPKDERLVPFIDLIINRQKSNGGWSGDAKVVVPMPGQDFYSKDTKWERLDVKGLFTSAMVVRLLSFYKNTNDL